MPGFNAPNTTPTPNELFDKYLPLLEKSELKVLLALIRATYGFIAVNGGRHLQAFSSIKNLARKTGLSENSVIAGASALEYRGLVKRLNRGKKETSKWEIIVNMPTSTTEGGRKTISLSGRGRSPSVVEGQVQVKKDIKKIPELKKEVSSPPDKSSHRKPFVQIPIQITTRFNDVFGEMGEKEYVQIVEFLNKDIDPKWIYDAIVTAQERNVKRWSYASAIIRDWKKNGRDEKSNNKKDTLYRYGSGKIVNLSSPEYSADIQSTAKSETKDAPDYTDAERRFVARVIARRNADRAKNS